ncbi:hypothetical protein N3C_1860 [Clostridium sp. N3C]|nr:hypothetical protein N3C_1860 [Clostridium sp. N3C]
MFFIRNYSIRIHSYRVFVCGYNIRKEPKISCESLIDCIKLISEREGSRWKEISFIN